MNTVVVVIFFFFLSLYEGCPGSLLGFLRGFSARVSTGVLYDGVHGTLYGGSLRYEGYSRAIYEELIPNR